MRPGQATRQARPPASFAIRPGCSHSLQAFGDWKSLRNPILREALVNLQDFEPREAHRAKDSKRRPDVRALAPRAAPAVKHDRLVAADSARPLAQRLDFF